MIPFVIGEEQYKFTNWDGVDLPVFVAKPGKINKATRLVVVMHGRKRNAVMKGKNGFFQLEKILMSLLN